MQPRCFGDTNLAVSPISLGCWIFGMDRWGHSTGQRAMDLLIFSHDQGITFFDGDDACGNGRAETILGQFLKTVPRDAVQIACKFGHDYHRHPETPRSRRDHGQDFSPRFLRCALEQSLKRLDTDYIDLYMARHINLTQFRDDLFAELHKVRDEGKIGVWGVSLGPSIGWREEGFKSIMEYNARAVQTDFNLFEQHPGRELCEAAHSHKSGVLARLHGNSSILNHGVNPDMAIPERDHRNTLDNAGNLYGPRKHELIQHYASDHGMTGHQLACKWLLMQPALTSITGTFLNENEIREAVEATMKPDLSLAEMRRLAEDYARNWDLGPDAQPCDLMSSVHPTGRVRSSYVPPPVLIA